MIMNFIWITILDNPLMTVFTILPLINACQLGREVGVGANCHFLLQGIAF